MRRTTNGARAALFCAAALLAAASASAADLTIAQIDSSPLLTRQRVHVFLDPTYGDGRIVPGLSSESFSLWEGPSVEALSPVPDFELSEGVNAAQGIAFYLVVDNSGSMYDRIDGSKASSDDDTRMAAVRRAVAAFLDSVDNPKDLIGLAAFNTSYSALLTPTAVRSDVETALGRIRRPNRAEAYTELYAALEEAADTLSDRKGRKVVILLSDGENYPYAPNEGKPHPVYGNRVAKSAEAMEALVRQGVSVFPVHFGTARRDGALRSIAAGTGGRLFDARGERELAAVYGEIRDRVLREYRLSYRPAMLAGDRRYVQVRWEGAKATQHYYAGTIFGSAAVPLSPLLLIPLLLALALWFSLTRLRLFNRRPDANLEVLDGGAARIFSLNDGKTVIDAGGGELTIAAAGAPEAAAGGGLTIVKDEKTGAFTISGGKPFYVNNKATTGRRLAAGDVIRVGEATIVFDEPTPDASRP